MTFVTGAEAVVTVAPGASLGNLCLFPASVDFGRIPAGEEGRRKLRLSNFGFSDLTILGVTSSASQFESFFTKPFYIPPFGLVELTVVFSSDQAGPLSGEISIVTDADGASGSQRVVSVRERGRSLRPMSVRDPADRSVTDSNPETRSRLAAARRWVKVARRSFPQ